MATEGQMALVTRSGPALTRTGISVRTTTPGVGTAALAVIGGDHGGIVATRRITAGCRAAAGNSSRLADWELKQNLPRAYPIVARHASIV
jgi:hypothetical protein